MADNKTVSFTIQVKDAATAALKQVENAAGGVTSKLFGFKAILGGIVSAAGAFSLATVIKDIVDLGVASDKTFRQIAASLPTFTEGIGALREEITQIANESGRSIESMQQSALAIAKLGVSSADELQQQLQAATMLADATGTNVDDAAQLLVQLRREFHLTGDEALATAAKLAAAAQGKTSIEELMGAFRSSAPIFEKFNIDVDTGTRAIIALVNAGIGARQVRQIIGTLDASGIRELADQATIAGGALDQLRKRADEVRNSTEAAGQRIKNQFVDNLETLGTRTLPTVNTYLAGMVALLDLIKAGNYGAVIAGFFGKQSDLDAAMGANASRNSAQYTNGVTFKNLNTYQPPAAKAAGPLILPLTAKEKQQITADFDFARKAVQDFTASTQKTLAGTTKSAADAAQADLDAFATKFTQVSAEIEQKIAALPVNAPASVRQQLTQQLADLGGAFADGVQERLTAIDQMAADEANKLRGQVLSMLTAFTGDVANAAYQAVQDQTAGLERQVLLNDKLSFAEKERLLGQIELYKQLKPLADAANQAIANAQSTVGAVDLGGPTDASFNALMARELELRQAQRDLVTIGGEQVKNGDEYRRIQDEINAIIKERKKLQGELLQTDDTATKTAEKRTQDLRAQVQQIQQAVDGAIQLAEAFHLTDQRTANTLRSISQMVSNLPVLIDAIERFNAGTGSKSDVALSALPVIGSAASIGSSSTSAVGAALGGAAAGAAAGAAIGSIVPVVGTAVGAVVGAVGGLVAGLFGHASSIKKAQQQFAQDEQTFVARLQEFPSSFAQTFQSIQDGLKQLEAAAKSAHTSVSSQAVQAAQDALARNAQSFKDSIDQQLNALGGPQGNLANQIAAVNKAYQDNLATAQMLGMGEDELQKIEQLRAASIDALTKAQQDADQSAMESLAIRQAQAKNDTALVRTLTEQDEIEQALKDGRSAEYIEMLKETQALEDQATATQKAADAAKAATDAAEKATEAYAGLAERFMKAIGDTTGADAAAQAEQQRQELFNAQQNGASADQLSQIEVVQMFERAQASVQHAIDAQTKVLQDTLTVDQDQLNTAKTQLQATQHAMDTLASYSKSLVLDPNLSALSPVDQYGAARTQLNDVFKAAMGGDANAAEQFPTIANTFLQQSKGYNASGGAYASDFQAVQQMLDQLRGSFGTQETAQQQIVDKLQQQIDALNKQLAALQDANTIAQQTKDAVIAELEKQREAALAPNTAMIDSLKSLEATLTGVGHDIVDAQEKTLESDRDAVNAANQAEIDAINSGASLEQLAALDQIRVLEEQKTATDDGFAKQITELGQQLGFDSPVVQQLIVQQKQYDDGVAQQINAINGLGAGIVGAIHTISFTGNDTGTPSSGLGTGRIGLGGVSDAPPEPAPTSLTGGASTEPAFSGPYDYAEHDGAGNLWLKDPYTHETYNLGRNPALPWTDPLGNRWNGDMWLAAGTDGGSLLPVQAFAAGGDFAGGMALTGERGMELQLTGPSRFVSNTDLRSMLAGSNAATGKDQLLELKAQTRELQALVRQQGAGLQAVVVRLGQVHTEIATQTKHQRLSADGARVRSA